MPAALFGVMLFSGAALAQNPGWSRAGKYLPISYEECMARAELAMKSQGLKVESRDTGLLLATKGVHLAVISCGATIDARMDVSVVVASNGGPREATTGLREVLNGEMAKSSCRPTPWGFQHCHGRVAAQ